MLDVVERTAPPVELPRILDLSRDELLEWCGRHQIDAYRADQLRRWIFGRRAAGYAEMTDLPASFRALLGGSFAFFTGTVAAHQVSTDGTEKLLIEWPDQQVVECVLMREEDRRTVCISTQVGCGMGCVFCASGMLGLKRNLASGEILEQILRLDRLLPKDERITNVVVMGMGEPLANLPNLLAALRSIDEKGGLGLGARRITISTVGLPEKIRELARVGKAYNLAVSLHAPNDDLRNRLVPVNDRIGLANVLAAADEFFEITGRRVTYEYVVLGDVNDGPEQALELAQLLAGRNAHINLIPMNAIAELSYHDPARQRLQEFVQILEQHHVTTTVRKRKGIDIDAACGQLRLRHTQGQTP